MKTNKDIINRVITATIILTLVFAPFAFIYFGTSATMGFLAGSAWNTLNLYLLSRISKIFMLPDEANTKWGILAAFFKFPVLYGTGYAIIKYTALSLHGILVGFSLVLVVFVLKMLGIYYSETFCQGTRNYGRNA